MAHALCSGGQAYSVALRDLRRTEGDLSARLKSIHLDAQWLQDELLPLLPKDDDGHDYPLFANLRCGLWYLPSDRWDGTCHFKSTDGHYGTWAFSTKRLNVDLLRTLHARGAAVVVDSTRKGKVHPDAFCRTIPIWAAVVNRLKGLVSRDTPLAAAELPFDASGSERMQIGGRVAAFVRDAEGCGVAWEELPLLRPVRAVLVGRGTDVPRLICSLDLDAFSYLFLVSASDPQDLIPRLPFTYVQGAGDDQEAWARGLTPALFWRHARTLLDAAPLECIEEAAALTCDAAAEPALVHSMAAVGGGAGGDRRGTCLPDTPLRLCRAAEIVPACPAGTVLAAESKAALEQFRRQLEAACCSLAVVEDGCLVRVGGEEDGAAAFDSLVVLVREDSKKDLEKALPHVVDFAARVVRGGSVVTAACASGNGPSAAVAVGVLCALSENGWDLSPEGVRLREGEGEGDAAPAVADKQQLRRTLARLTTYASSAAPSRNLMKQLNRYFMPH